MENKTTKSTFELLLEARDEHKKQCEKLLKPIKGSKKIKFTNIETSTFKYIDTLSQICDNVIQDIIKLDQIRQEQNIFCKNLDTALAVLSRTFVDRGLVTQQEFNTTFEKLKVEAEAKAKELEKPVEEVIK